MNALFLKDLAAKTHRGLHGRVEEGRSAGGRVATATGSRGSYDARGEPVRGGREIDEAEAAIVRRIFDGVRAGRARRATSPSASTATVCRARTAAPGDPRRSTATGAAAPASSTTSSTPGGWCGTASASSRTPTTGKRQARPNPPEEWVRREVPELRIVDEELWQAVKAAPGPHPRGRHGERRRRRPLRARAAPGLSPVPSHPLRLLRRRLLQDQPRPLWLLERPQPRHLRQPADDPPRRAGGERAVGPAHASAGARADARSSRREYQRELNRLSRDARRAAGRGRRPNSPR